MTMRGKNRCTRKRLVLVLLFPRQNTVWRKKYKIDFKIQEAEMKILRSAFNMYAKLRMTKREYIRKRMMHVLDHIHDT